MLTKNEVLNMKAFYINHMQNKGRLTLEQQQTLNEMQFKFVRQRSGQSGSYDPDTNIFTLNLNYSDRYVLEQTVFHEMDHARTSYDDGYRLDEKGFAIRKRQTGAFIDSGKIGLKDNGDMVGISKGEMLGEGATAINGENVYHAYKGDTTNWHEQAGQTPDMNLFPRHRFPSGLWWYKLNANFISQLACVFGVHEDEICKVLDKGKEGRKILADNFKKYSGNVAFEDFEKDADIAATVAKCALALGKKSINARTIKKADLSIDIAQLQLCQLLQDAYKNGRISQKQFMERHNKFMRYATTDYVKDAMKQGTISALRESGVNVQQR